MINITNVTLASDDDWQREAPEVRQQIYYTTQNKIRYSTNFTLACNDDNIEERTANMKNATTILVWGPDTN